MRGARPRPFSLLEGPEGLQDPSGMEGEQGPSACWRRQPSGVEGGTGMEGGGVVEAILR